MALNPAYEAIGKSFVEQYYNLFDDANTRPNLINLYNVSISRDGIFCTMLFCMFMVLRTTKELCFPIVTSEVA